MRRWRRHPEHPRWPDCARARQDKAREEAEPGLAVPRKPLGDDDAGFVALELGSSGELAAEEFDEAARTRAAVGAQQSHAVEKNQQIENIRIFEIRRRGALGLLFFDFGEKGDQSSVEFARERSDRRFFIHDAGAERLVSFGESVDGREYIGIRCGGLDGAEFGDGESHGGHQLLMCVDDVLRNLLVQQWSVRRNLALVLVFVAMGGDQIGAVRWAIDSDFALGAAADRADFFAFCGTKSCGFAFFTDRTGHRVSWTPDSRSAEYAAAAKITKVPATGKGSRQDSAGGASGLETTCLGWPPLRVCTAWRRRYSI